VEKISHEKCQKKQTVKSYLLHQKFVKKVMWKGLLEIVKKNWFVDNFNLLHSKERKGQKYNATDNERDHDKWCSFKNVLSNEET
jgi:hypothetical protein